MPTYTPVLMSVALILFAICVTGCEEQSLADTAEDSGASGGSAQWLTDALREQLASSDKLVVRQSWPRKRFTVIEQHQISRGTSVFEHRLILHLIDDDGHSVGSIDLFMERYLALEDGYHGSMSPPHLEEEEIGDKLRLVVQTSVSHRTEWSSADDRPRPERFVVGERTGRAVFVGTDDGFRLDPERSEWTKEELAELGTRSPVWWKD